MPEPRRLSIVQRLSALPTQLPPVARQAATFGARLFVALAWCAAALAFLVGFATLHMRLETGRRAAIEITQALLDDAIQGRIRIGRVAELAPERVSLRDVVITDPEGNVVIVADRVTADVDPWRLLRGEIRFERVSVHRPHVSLRAGETDYVSLLDTFRPRRPAVPGAPTPDVVIAKIHLEGASCSGELPGVFDLDVRRISAGASLRYEDGVPDLDVSWLRGEVRAPVAAPVALAGRVHLSGASADRPGSVHGNARLRWGRSDVYSAFGVSSERIRVLVETEGLHPEDVRALGVAYPLEGLLRGRAAVDGPPDRLRAIALLRLEAGRLQASGTFTFGPPPRYVLDVATDGIDLARIAPDAAPSSTLGFHGRISGQGLSRGTLDARAVGLLHPGVVAEYPTPGGRLDVRFDPEGLEIVRFEPKAPGLGGMVRGRVGFDGAVDARGEVHSHRLALVHGLRRVGGSASARFRFRRETEGRLLLDLDGAARALEFGPARFGEADISAHFVADLPAITGRVQARGSGLVFSDVTLGAATVTARGDRRTVHLSLHSVDPDRRESVLEAVIHPDPEGFTAEVTEVQAGFVGEPLRGSLRRLDYRRRRVSIEDLVLVRGDARLTATGTYDLAGRVHGVVTANNLDLGELKRFLGERGPAIEGRMGIRLEVDGPVRRPDFDLSADIHGGRYGDLAPLDVGLQAEGRGGTVFVDSGVSLSGTEVLHVAGTTPFDLGRVGLARFIGPGPRDLQIDLSGLDLDRFAFLVFEPGAPRPATGVVSGTIRLRGSWADPEMSVELRAARARLGSLEDVEVTLQATHAARRTQFHLNVQRMSQLALDAEGTWDADLGVRPERPLPPAESLWVAPLAARVSVGPLDLATLPTTMQPDPPISARVVLAGDVTGSLRKPAFDGQVDLRGVEGDSLPWNGALGGRFDVEYADETLRVEGDLADAESIIAQIRGRLGIDLVAAARGHVAIGDGVVSATFEDVSVSRIRFFDGKPVEGSLHGHVEVGVAAGVATLHGTVGSNGLKVGQETIPELTGRVDYSGQLLTIALHVAQARGGTIDARATWRLPWNGNAGTTLDQLGWPLSGDLEAHRFAISSLLPSIPEVAELDGHLDGRVTLVRFEEAPQMSGRLAISDGKFEIAGFGQRLTNISVAVNFQGTRFSIDSLRFRDRNGTVEGVRSSPSRPVGEGTLHDLVPRTFNLNLAASRFPIVREGIPLARVTARIHVAGAVLGRTVDLTARVRGAKVLLPDRPTRDLQSLDDHPDVEIVTRTAVAVGPSQDPILFVVHVKLENDMWIERSDMRLAFLGDVDLRYPWGRKLTIGGTVEVTRGEAEAYGRRFRIDQGVVTFEPTPQIDPILDVRAKWEHPEYTVYLRVAGRLSRPRITFASEPSLSQDQIVSLLVLGRTENTEDGPDPNATAAQQTSALLQGIGAAIAQESVREALPEVVPIVAIEPGQEGLADARYRAGSQVADRLYVEGSYTNADATQSGENTTEVRIEYRLNRRWSVQSHAGDENGGADMLWSYSY